MVKNLLANAGDVRDPGSILWLGKSPGGGCGNPLQYSCLENSWDRGAWLATVHRVTKSWTQLKRLSMHSRVYFACGINIYNLWSEGRLLWFYSIPTIFLTFFSPKDGV